ncbi:MAG: GNAT family N-acetyltransferase [Saprospiraceae bacterium]|nr:GNAT family N-acetyltransferase [Saprospiraceae bacterium]
MKIIGKRFDDLSPGLLYDIMVLRQEVFVVEQDCPYLDADGKDLEAIHLVGFVNGELVAYARVMPIGVSYDEYASIGRVIVTRDYRRQGLGTEVLAAAIRACREHFHTDRIKISAQTYTLKLYEELGFRAVGPQYLEDGIPHRAMILEESNNF